MKYTVEFFQNDKVIQVYMDVTKKQAIKLAKSAADLQFKAIISGYNGQCTVYLNPNGNHELVGKFW